MNNINEREDFKFITGKVEWNKYKSFLSPTKQKDSIQIIYGENIQRYRWQDAILRADKIYINNYTNTLPILKEKAIIIQRTTSIEQKNRIIANIIDPKNFTIPIVTENNTSYMLGKDIKLYYLLGCLSTNLLNFYFNLINSNVHVSAGELNSLPIPIPTPEQEQIITSLVDYLLFLHNEKSPQLISHTSNERVIVHIENIMNMVIYELYFEEHMKEQKIDVAKYLSPKCLTELMNADEKADIIKDFYLWYQSAENIIRQRILLVDTRSPDLIHRINQET